MRNLLILVTLALMTPAALGLNLADPTGTAVCTDPLEHDWFDTPEPLSDPLFDHLFPALDLVKTNDRSRLPEIPELWAQGPLGVCDLDDLSSLLDRSGRALTTQADYEAAAWLLAQTTDEAVLGVQLFDGITAFEPTADGAIVDLATKSPATGALVDWHVVIGTDGAGSATWTVRAIEPGLRTGMEGWFIAPGDSGPFAASDVGTQAVKLYPTHDGKNVRITYNTNNYPDIATAELDADRNGNAGVLAYNTFNVDWDLHSADPDQFLDITLDGCACIFSGNNVNIHMPPLLLQWIRAIGLGLDYPSEEGVINLVVAHEFFHHFQYSIMQWNQGGWVVEGTARFSETIFHPQETHQPQSLTYHPSINGFTYMMINPTAGPAGHSYSFGLAWGHMYDTNGGVAFLKRLLEESAADPSVPAFIDRTLAAMPGDHDTFGAAVADLGPRMLTRSFEWATWDGGATYDWGDFLPPVFEERLRPTSTSGYWTRAVGAFGLSFLNLTVAGSTTPVAAVTATGPPDLEFFFFGDGTTTPFIGAHADTTSTDKHVFVVHNDLAPVAALNQVPAQAVVLGATQ